MPSCVIIVMTCAHAVQMAIVVQTETGNNSVTEKQPESRKQESGCKSKQEGTKGIPIGAVYVTSNAAPGI